MSREAPPAALARGAPWPAPAKLNLFLHVMGRRVDGYHELQTLFQIVDLADELEVAPRRDGLLVLAGSPPGVAPEEDLVMRAARLLRTQAGEPRLGARLELRKRIPTGGGLGGGSSDAATALVALDALWGLDLGTARLAELGLTLGADVPVFVHGVTALGRGVGERLAPCELPPLWFAIVWPGVATATREVFQAPELTRNSAEITMPGLLWPGWAAGRLPGRNDLEPVVVRRHPEVAAALAWLGTRGAARLTGSGACVFAAFASAAAANAALEGLPARWTGYVVAGLARSPLLARRAAVRHAAGDG
jgi:4-diphosphocytidyl-2-C-methyl-D-erythritol kinase